MVVFQDFLSKWPLVFAVADQKALTIAQLLVEKVIPMFGVPEALLSDRGTNLLSHLMQDICKMLGIVKLNTTAYHPQCDGMVERLTAPSKPFSGNTLSLLESLSSCMESCGPIATLHMSLQARSHHSCCLVWTAVHQQKQPIYPLLHCALQMSRTTGRN